MLRIPFMRLAEIETDYSFVPVLACSSSERATPVIIWPKITQGLLLLECHILICLYEEVCALSSLHNKKVWTEGASAGKSPRRLPFKPGGKAAKPHKRSVQMALFWTFHPLVIVGRLVRAARWK